MKFCKYCGVQLDENALFCPFCGKALNVQVTNNETNTDDAESNAGGFFKGENKKKLLIYGGIGLAVAAIVIIIILAVGSGKCKHNGCGNNAVGDSKYCYFHKCSISDCVSPSASYSNYCYSHYLIYDDDAEENSNYVSSYDLKISNVRVYTSGSYTYAEGSLKNTSDSTVSYVKVKGAFKDYRGNVIDTDWTYAVGSEGLAPGESCKWKLWADKDYSIDECDVSILDFDY